MSDVESSEGGSSMKPLVPGWDLALARLVLAGIFGLAAYTKISDPQSFALAISSFDIVQQLPGLDEASAEAVIGWTAYLMAWVEAVCALALLLGFWTRAAAMVLFILLIGFAGAMLSVIARGMAIDCQCFGKLDFFGDGEVTWKSILRNVIFMAVAAPVMVRGAGGLGIDTWWARRGESDGS